MLPLLLFFSLSPLLPPPRTLLFLYTSKPSFPFSSFPLSLLPLPLPFSFNLTASFPFSSFPSPSASFPSHFPSSLQPPTPYCLLSLPFFLFPHCFLPYTFSPLSLTASFPCSLPSPLLFHGHLHFTRKYLQFRVAQLVVGEKNVRPRASESFRDGEEKRLL